MTNKKYYEQIISKKTNEALKDMLIQTIICSPKSPRNTLWDIRSEVESWLGMSYKNETINKVGFKTTRAFEQQLSSIIDNDLRDLRSRLSDFCEKTSKHSTHKGMYAFKGIKNVQAYSLFQAMFRTRHSNEECNGFCFFETLKGEFITAILTMDKTFRNYFFEKEIQRAIKKCKEEELKNSEIIKLLTKE